jgi:16S rRNA (uracil1498-N3)-methyltransferase
MGRFYVPRESVREGKIFINGPEAHHIVHVMRLRKADKGVAFDGEGKEYQGVIREVRPKGLTIDIVQTRDIVTEDSVSVTLAQAIPKKEKMDYIVEKAVEIGLRSIIPVQTARTVVRLAAERAPSRVERWRRIAREAAKQCGSQTVPTVERVVDFDTLLGMMGKYELCLMACLAGDTAYIKEVLKAERPETVLLCIGPEGDFAPEEIGRARSNGAKLVSLGQRVFKSDTASLAALAMIHYEYGS